MLIKFSLKQIKPEPFLFRRLPLLSSPISTVLSAGQQKNYLADHTFWLLGKQGIRIAFMIRCRDDAAAD